MLPDDCRECRVCGVPCFGWGGICSACERVTDNKGRFVKKEVADRYRALLKTSLWLTGASNEEVAEARRQLNTFWQDPL